ncbi:MAG: hypothetical protein Fur0010_22840 [Bdellovibrio sp.]
MNNNWLEHPLVKSRMNEVRAVRQKLKAKNLDPEQFCIMPFVNIILEPDGSIGLCRQKGTDFSLGNIQDKTISEIWNGPFARRWRREFLQGRSVICKSELRDRGCQLCPSLNTMLEQAELKETQTQFPLRLTANFNGKCNLECQMCNVWQLPNGLYNEINFWEPAERDIFPHLEEIDMLSGEPFIQPDTYKLINKVSAVNPACKWSITTNMHWKLNEKIKSDLDKIVFKNLIMSIDSLVPETYAIIRSPGKLSIVLENLDLMLKYQEDRVRRGLSSLNIHVNFLIQKDNWKEAKHMIAFCLNHNIMPFLTFLYRPERFSLLNLPKSEIDKILDFYQQNCSWSELALMRRVWIPLLDFASPIVKANFLVNIENLKNKNDKNLPRDFLT